MQSLFDTGIHTPLSPSAFTFDGHGQQQSSTMDNDGEVDLFRYYLDLQAFQGKDMQAIHHQPPPPTMGAYSNGLMDDMTSTSSSSSSLSPYNAFYNPLSSSSSTSLPPSLTQSTLDQQQQQHATSTVDSNNLFPFAEAGMATYSNSMYRNNNNAQSPATMNPAQLLSYTHLAGSENPQPIDPHLLLGNSTLPSFTASNVPLPTIVKQEDVDSSLPLNNQAPVATTTTMVNPSRRSTSLRADSNAHHDSEDENDVMDGMQDDQDDDSDDSEEEEEEEAMPARKRSTRGGAASSNTKKRTSVSKSTSSNTKKNTSQSRKESSVLSSNGGGHHSQQQHPHALVPVPEYEDRPSKAEYDKLSSKEKRQMRNKISARNFRHRRKAHIDTLEALVADKEGIIDVLQEEVGTLRSENKGLRADIELLKKNWESIAAKIGAVSSVSSSVNNRQQQQQQQQLTPDEDDLYGGPASLPALSPAASSSAESTNGDHLSELSFEQRRTQQQGASAQAQAQVSIGRPSTSSSSSSNANANRVTRSSAITRPNFRKDLGPSGNSFSAFGAGNRSMNVHTTLIPEINFNFPIPPASVFDSAPSAPPSSASSTTGGNEELRENNRLNSLNNASVADVLAGKRDKDTSSSNAAAQQARLNMNPALNGLTQEQINNLREQFFSSSSSSVSFDNNVNATSGKVRNGGNNMNTLDPLQNSFFDTNPFISLRDGNLQDYRAQLYAKLANNVAGIHQAQQQQQMNSGNGNKNVNMQGLRPAFFANGPSSEVIHIEEEIVKIAHIAQKTLFDKLSTAFWDAFTGTPSTATTGKSMLPPSSSSSSSSSPRASKNNSLDGQKVADVLAGRSRLAVVKEDDAVADDALDGLSKQVQTMALTKKQIKDI